MIASDYPVTLPYGATSPPYGTPLYPYHRGEDRAMPDGVPVLVNGVQIGLSGHTGFVTGPHLHIGHFIGNKDVNPNGQGFIVPGAKVTIIERNDPIDGNDVHLRGEDGTDWVYLHLSRVDVTEGQIIQGEEMVDDPTARAMLTMSTLLAQDGVDTPDRQPTLDEVKNLIGRTPLDAAQQIMSYEPWQHNKLKVKVYDQDVANAAQNALNKTNVETYINKNLS